MIADPKKKSLIIVESPTKAKTIKAYLPSSCTVIASMGHIAELNPTSTVGYYGVDTSHNFELDYVIESGKEKVLKEMKSALSSSEQLILASDEDREGESIAYHVYNYLKPKVPVYRMVFHEITKKAITEAFNNCRELDMSLVRAQEARRAIDRLQGYGISGIVSNKLSGKYSAGRVQSPALKMIYEKENERRKHTSSSFYSLDANCEGKRNFTAQLSSIANLGVATSKSYDPITGALKKGYVVLDEKKCQEIQKELLNKNLVVSDIKESEKVEHPSYPFTTSTLQMDATRKLSRSAKAIMATAQSLYEKGFITYMRTDSPTLSAECINAASDYIKETFGESFLKTRQYKAKTLGAQEAHEAIRPAGDHFRRPEETGLTGDELKLYTLIWKRTIASQMKDSVKALTTVHYTCGDYGFTSNGSVIKYPGFRAIYSESTDENEEEEAILPSLSVGESYPIVSTSTKAHSTQPPLRYTEASLIQRLEKEEIGRPSTYATIISTLLDRNYAVKENGNLVPTFTGFFVSEFLLRTFSLYIDYDYTKHMEASLDKIASGSEDKTEFLRSFWFGSDSLEEYNYNNEGLKASLDRVKATLSASDVKTLNLCGLTYSFNVNNEDVKYSIKTGKFGPYILTSLKEGTPSKDLMRSIPQDIYPGSFTDETAKAIIFPEEKDDTILYGKYALKKGRYGIYFERVADGERVSCPRLYQKKNPEEIEESIIDLLFTLPLSLGFDSDNNEAILKIGPYGYYASYKGENIKVVNPLNVTLESLIQPEIKEIKDELDGKPLELKKGKYGYYIKWGDDNIALPYEYKKDTSKLTSEKIKEIALGNNKEEKAAPKAEKEFSGLDNTKAYLINGKYGLYLKWGSENIALSKDIKDNPDSLTDEAVASLIEEYKAKPKASKKKFYKKK